jgi:myo-inositol-1(or 4)-monophosphatase
MNQETLLRSFRPETVEAVAVVTAALKLAKEAAPGATISYKQGRDIVTAVDLAIEDEARRRLRAAFGLPVVGEERGGDVQTRAPHWLLDPICGTRAYASGIPMYSVNLALAEAGEVVIGVAADASRNEVVIAERGKGTWALRGAELIAVQTNADTNTIVIEEPEPGDGSARGARREHTARYIAEAIRADKWEFRSLGTTLGLPYVAAGRIAAYIPLYCGVVHVAAGTLIASEAGCIVTDATGVPWSPASESLLVAATPQLHAELLEISLATAP